MTSSRFFRAALLLLLAPSLPGCGDDRPTRYPVSGQVLIDGEPLTRGFIRLVAENARPAHGRIGPDGRFTLTCYEGQDGSVPGTHIVLVTAVGNIDDGAARKWSAPMKYADPKTSDLRVTIDGPTDSLVIELTWDGEAPYVEES